MEQSVIQRVKDLIASKDLTPRSFAERINFNYSTLNNYLTGRRTNINVDLVKSIVSSYDDINPDWLLTGSGEMYLSNEPQPHPVKQSKRDIPYYEKLPVSAGQIEVVLQEANPSGYMFIPGVHAIAFFPVIGCSMSPRINEGDIIGVDNINSWETPDPDKIYLIITNEDRMIKHLQADANDPEILWAISDNKSFDKFKILKENIKYIYRVTYRGEKL